MSVLPRPAVAPEVEVEGAVMGVRLVPVGVMGRKGLVPPPMLV